MTKALNNQKPKRSLGQNFLVDQNYQKKILKPVLQAYKNQTVVEIGPGRGALTQHLKTFSKKLILIEKDQNFAEFWQNDFSEESSFAVIHTDVLKWQMDELEGSNHLAIGNLPYNISTQILIQFLKKMKHFESLTFMFQKEVAMRCLAQPKSKSFGPLAIWTALFANAKKICDVPATAFRPRPRVTSTVLHFERNENQYSKEWQRFIDFVRILFSQRRKKIKGLLVKAGYTKSLLENFKEICDRRAEELTLNQMKTFYDELVSASSNKASNLPS